MKYEPALKPGKLQRRYKRFLADIELATGSVTTIHCPNTGSMKNCAEPGFGVWFSESDNPKRKYPFTWEIAETPAGHLIGINTHRANGLVKEAIEAGRVDALKGYSGIATEVKYGQENSRIDLLLTEPGLPDCYVEVKSVTLLEGQLGYFPDAVSARGQKHLRELAEMAAAGHRAVLFFCVQHTGIEQVAAAAHIDPDYAAALTDAVGQGVEVMCYRCNITPEQNRIEHAVPFVEQP